jgi:phosphoglycolate phosphatase
LFDSWEFEGAALFFDKDGTLTDLRYQYINLMEKRLDRLSALCPFDKVEIRRAIGLAVGYEEETETISSEGPLATATRAETMAMTAKVFCKRGMAMDRALEISERAFLEADQELSLADLIKPAEGLIPVLSSLYQSGLIIACLTNDENERTRKILQFLGADSFFHLVLCANEVTRPKPDPEMFHQACTRLSIFPSQVAYVGDSVLDMVMARFAGAGGVVGILGGACGRDVLQEKADVVIPDLKAISVQA